MKAKTIEVGLGGQQRTMRFDIGAIEDYERATTYVLEDGTVIRGSALNGVMPQSTHEFTALIWACLKAHVDAENDRTHKKTAAPTRRQVSVWLGEDGAMDQLYADLVALLVDNTPEPEEEEEDQDGPLGSPGETG